MLQQRIGKASGFEGTLFDKPASSTAAAATTTAATVDAVDEEGEESSVVKVEQDAAAAAVATAADEMDEDAEMHDVDKQSPPSQISIEEVEDQVIVHPRVKRRKLAHVAKLAKRDLTIDEGSEEVSYPQDEPAELSLCILTNHFVVAIVFVANL